uniref:Uncharacterized protein n=1 Tax=Cannabis sativa TaxID=3483 RepID=A0A803PP96_CANSA
MKWAVVGVRLIRLRVRSKPELQIQHCVFARPTSMELGFLQLGSDSGGRRRRTSLELLSERRNAIGKDFLRGFKECLEAVSKDSSANVVLIRSLVPNVFCAGADLKHENQAEYEMVKTANKSY